MPPAETMVNNHAVTAVPVNGWNLSTSRPDHFDKDYLQDGNSGKGTKSVTFTPNLPMAGNCNVSMMWSQYPHRAPIVPVEILHS